MTRAIIVDDEKHCSESLALLIEKYVPDMTIEAELNDPLEALDVIISKKPDLVFLDIEMPRLNGFDLLKSLPVIDFEIIFTTAYDDFAIQAFKVSAIDYLLKPIERDELTKAVEKFKKHRADRDFENRFMVFLSKYGRAEKGNLGKVALPTQEGFEFIDQGIIVRCESDSNYTTVVLEGEKNIVVSRTLKDVESMLDSTSFVRVHHSHLINLRHIRKYHKGSGGVIVMDNGDNVSVSRSKKGEFLDRI